MKLQVESTNNIKKIAQWICENVSIGYEYRPMWSHQSDIFYYSSYNNTWRITQEFDYKNKKFNVSIDGLNPDEESVIAIIFS